MARDCHAGGVSDSERPPLHWLGQKVRVVIERPIGSHHPEHGFIYEVNYGYLPGVPAPDGEELDAYVLGVEVPIEECRGRVVAIVHRRDDVEDKLVVSLGGTWDSHSIARAIDFQERYSDAEVVMKTHA